MESVVMWIFAIVCGGVSIACFIVVGAFMEEGKKHNAVMAGVTAVLYFISCLALVRLA